MTFLKCLKGIKKRASDISLDSHLFSANRCIGPFLPVLVAPSSSSPAFTQFFLSPRSLAPCLSPNCADFMLERFEKSKQKKESSETWGHAALVTGSKREFNLSVKNEGYIYYIYIQLCTGFESLFYPHCFYQLVTHRHTA